MAKADLQSEAKALGIDILRETGAEKTIGELQAEIDVRRSATDEVVPPASEDRHEGDGPGAEPPASDPPRVDVGTDQPPTKPDLLKPPPSDPPPDRPSMETIQDRVRVMTTPKGPPIAVHTAGKGLDSAVAVKTTSKFVATQWWHLHEGKRFHAPKNVVDSLVNAGFAKRV